MVGVNRVIKGTSITHLLGDVDATLEQEKELNKRYFDLALEVLQTPVEEYTLFRLP